MKSLWVHDGLDVLPQLLSFLRVDLRCCCFYALFIWLCLPGAGGKNNQNGLMFWQSPLSHYLSLRPRFNTYTTLVTTERSPLKGYGLKHSSFYFPCFRALASMR
jgi:hypothetical protein